MALLSWVQNSSGDWSNASAWGGTAPTMYDSVFIGIPGITVTVTGFAQAYTLQTQYSTLSINGGTLSTVSNAIFGGVFTEAGAGSVFSAGGHGATFGQALDFYSGTILVQTGGVLNVNAGGILAGTLGGGGALNLNNGITAFQSGFVDNLGSVAVNGGTLLLQESFTAGGDFSVGANGSVNLNGYTLIVSGSAHVFGTLNGGQINESGTLYLGTGATLDNGLLLNVSGTVNQTGTVSFGARDAGARVTIVKSGHYNINGNWGILDPSSIGTLVNAGNLSKTGGGKTATINTGLTSTGTITVGIGELLLNGLVNTVNGTVTGQGTLGIAGGQTTFGNALSLGTLAGVSQQSGVLVINKSLSYGGEWDMNGGVLNLNTAKTTLTLTGGLNLDGGTLSGYGGTILIKGAAQAGNLTIGGPNTLTVSSTFDQTGSIGFGLFSTPTINVLAGAQYLLEGDSSILGFGGTINNAGLFIDPNGSGDAIVQAHLNSTGTLTVDAQSPSSTNNTLTLNNSSSLGGTVNGTGVLDIEAFVTIQNKTQLSIAHLDVGTAGTLNILNNLALATDYAQAGGTLSVLPGTTFTASGAELDNGVLATGTLAVAGNAEIAFYNVGAGANLVLAGTAEETATTTLTYGTVTVLSGGVLTLDDAANLSDASGPAGSSVNVAGTLIAAGTGDSQIGPALNLTGTLDVNNRTLSLQEGGKLSGTVTGGGTLQLNGGTFSLGAGLALGAGTVLAQSNATLQLAANVSDAGYFVDKSITVLNGNTLSLSDTTLLAGASLNGPGVLNASGSTTLNVVGVSSGATLALGGATEQAGSMQLTSGSVIIAGGATDTLDASASIFGTGTLTVNGALVAGSNSNETLSPIVVDNGTISAALGTLTMQGAISGTGKITIGAAATLNLGPKAAAGSGLAIGFTAGHADLVINDTADFAATLANFTTGDMIELAGFQGSSLTGTLNGSGTQLTVTDSLNHTIVLGFSTAITPGSLSFGTAADGNALITHH